MIRVAAEDVMTNTDDAQTLESQRELLLSYAKALVTLWKSKYHIEWMFMASSMVDASSKEYGWDRVKRTEMYHLIAGSSPHKPNRYFDLEGKGSILKLLEADLAVSDAEGYRTLRAEHPYARHLESGIYPIED